MTNMIKKTPTWTFRTLSVSMDLNSSGNTTYDYERRLTSITLPSGDTVRYKYLPDGTRIMRANGTETEYYLHDREDRIGDYDENGNLLIAYTHGPGIDEPVAMTVNGSTYFYIPDIHGSIRAIADINGNLMASYVYDVWGNLISHDGPLSERNDYLYTGREYDWETGIYYYRYRYYNPEIGRFMQSSWELNEEMNMYVYVNNDPVKGTDPTGHPYRPPWLPDHGSGTPKPSNYNFWVCVCRDYYCACNKRIIGDRSVVSSDCWQNCANCLSGRYKYTSDSSQHHKVCNRWHRYRICREYPWADNPCGGTYSSRNTHRISSIKSRLIR